LRKSHEVGTRSLLGCLKYHFLNDNTGCIDMGAFFSVGSYILAFFCALATVGAAVISHVPGLIIFPAVTLILMWMGHNAKRLFSDPPEDQHIFRK